MHMITIYLALNNMCSQVATHILHPPSILIYEKLCYIYINSAYIMSFCVPLKNTFIYHPYPFPGLSEEDHAGEPGLGPLTWFDLLLPPLLSRHPDPEISHHRLPTPSEK